MNLEILENQSVSVFGTLFFLGGKGTFLDLLDMFNLKKLHVWCFFVFFCNIWSEMFIFDISGERQAHSPRARALC